MTLARDASEPALAAASNDPWTTASFNPPNDSLLVVVAMGDWFGGDPTITISDSLSQLTFTSQVRQGALNQGVVEIFTAPVGSNGGSRTISGATSLTSDVGGIKVYVFTDAQVAAMNATGSGTSTTNSITPTVVTTTVDGCWVVGGGVDWNSNGTPTSTDDEEGFDDADLSLVAVAKSAATATAGAETLNFDAGGTGAAVWSWAAVAVGPSTWTPPAHVSGTGAATSGTTTTSVTINKPAGVAVDDVLYAVVTNGGANAAPSTVPSGWTLVDSNGTALGTTIWGGVYRRIVDGTEGASFTWSGFTNSCTGCMVAVTGADVSGTPERATTSSVNTTGAGAGAITANDQDLILAFAAVDDNAGTTSAWACATDPTSLTEHIEQTSSGGVDTLASIASATKTGDGSTGALTFTVTGGDDNVGILVAVKNASAGPPTVTGQATGAFGFTGTAVGQRTATGTASGSFGFTGAAAGVDRALGVAAASFGFTGTAAGVDRAVGQATGSFGFTGSASGVAGTPPVSGQAAAAFGFTGTAAGVRRTPGTAAAAFGFTATAAGVDRVVGTASSSFGFVGTAAGVDRAVGQAVATFGFTGDAVGLVRVFGVAVVAFGFTGDAQGFAGTPPVTGTASGSFGFTAAAAGVSRTLGVAVVAFGFTGTAAGVDRALGAAVAAFGFTADAAGAVTVFGVAVAQLGFTADAAGTPPDVNGSSTATTVGAVVASVAVATGVAGSSAATTGVASSTPTVTST